MASVIKRKFSLSDDERHYYINLISNTSIIINPEVKVSILKKDTTDNKIIECAISGNAKYIITGDKQLLELKEYEGIKIVNPKQFLEIVK